MRDPLHGVSQTLPIGEAISATLLLQKRALELGWGIAASVTTLRGITGAVSVGARALIDLPGRSVPMDAIELVTLAL